MTTLPAAQWSPLPTKLSLLPPPNSSASFLLVLTIRTSYYTSGGPLTSIWPCSWTSSTLVNWICWRTTLMSSCLLPATSRLKGSHQPHPPSNPSQVFRPHKQSRDLVHSLPPLLSRLKLLFLPLLNQLLLYQPLTYTIRKLVLIWSKKSQVIPLKSLAPSLRAGLSTPIVWWRRCETLRVRGGWSVFCAEKTFGRERWWRTTCC